MATAGSQVASLAVVDGCLQAERDQAPAGTARAAARARQMATVRGAQAEHHRGEPDQATQDRDQGHHPQDSSTNQEHDDPRRRCP